jgi:hypothetical protein
MTFKASEDQTRVFDSERGLELFRKGSGPGAWEAFEIVGEDISIPFLGVQTVTEESRGPPGDYLTGQPCWKIYFHVKYDLEKLKAIENLVAEAMITYKSVFGMGRPEWEYSVQFLPWGADID